MSHIGYLKIKNKERKQARPPTFEAFLSQLDYVILPQFEIKQGSPPR